MQAVCQGKVVKITHTVCPNFHSAIIPSPKLSGAILDCGFWIADLLYRFALSILNKSIRRRRTINLNSKIPNPKSMRRFGLVEFFALWGSI